MKEQKYHIYLTEQERSEVIKSLIDLKNTLTRLTRRLGDEIAAVYGFDIPKQRTPQERGAR